MIDENVLQINGYFGRVLLIDGDHILHKRKENEIFKIKWTQLERIEMDRSGLKKILRFRCFNRTEEISTFQYKKKHLRSAYFQLVDLAVLNGIKVMEINSW